MSNTTQTAHEFESTSFGHFHAGFWVTLAMTAQLASADLFTINTKNTSLVLTNWNSIHQLYYGKTLANPADLQTVGGHKPEAYAARGGWNHFGGLGVVHPDGNTSLDMKCATTTVKTIKKGVKEHIFELKDAHYPFRIKLHYRAYHDSDVIETWCEFFNDDPKQAIKLDRFDSVAMAMNAPAKAYELDHYVSNWGSEFQLQRETLGYGTKTIQNRAGVRGSFGANPSFMLALGETVTETTGEVIAGALAWSGTWHVSIDRNQHNQISINAGINPANITYTLDAGKSFLTPKFVMTHSSAGRGQASRNLHLWARKHQLREGDRLRPVLLNSWEGAYFTFDQKLLASMMDGVKTLGGELFVLDDGWFGNKHPRNHDRAGLGDWDVNHKKLPGGIKFLTDAAKKRGLKFGIWVEPEMVNPKSELYETHPEWIIQQPNRPNLLARTQAVLDLANPKVQDYVFGVVDKLLSENPEIYYIKWDANRDFSHPGSTYLTADKQQHIWVDYIRGLYGVLAKLEKKHPTVIFKACASGGGRVDYGILNYCHEFWTSDNTDSLRRIYIQWGTGQIYPACAMAAHVSIVPNHQTKRSEPLKFRFDVAMTGRMGFELNPAKMSKTDVKFAQAAVKCYKDIRPIVQQGLLYRLVSPYEGTKNYASLLYTTADKSQAVVFGYCMRKMMSESLAPVKLAGLDPKATYRVKEINIDTARPKNRQRHTHLSGKTLTGQSLMQIGMPIQFFNDYDSCVIKLAKITPKPKAKAKAKKK